MADAPAPYVNGKNWWNLRAAFQRSLPKVVTDTYLATVLSLEINAAKAVQRNLRLLGLVGQDNEPTDLAIRWRDDEQYAEVCQEIAKHAYPEELLSAVPGPSPDAAAASQWFQRSRRLGQGAAGNVARTYVLIVSGELASDGGADTSGRSASGSRNGRSPKGSRKNTKKGRRRAASTQEPPNNGAPGGFEMPRPQIAVQVNVSPDMTPEQIDQVFASMARHFYGQGSS